MAFTLACRDNLTGSIKEPDWDTSIDVLHLKEYYFKKAVEEINRKFGEVK
jgi:hypothetical protein